MASNPEFVEVHYTMVNQCILNVLLFVISTTKSPNMEDNIYYVFRFFSDNVHRVSIQMCQFLALYQNELTKMTKMIEQIPHEPEVSWIGTLIHNTNTNLVAQLIGIHINLFSDTPMDKVLLRSKVKMVEDMMSKNLLSTYLKEMIPVYKTTKSLLFKFTFNIIPEHQTGIPMVYHCLPFKFTLHTPNPFQAVAAGATLAPLPAPVFGNAGAGAPAPLASFLPAPAAVAPAPKALVLPVPAAAPAPKAPVLPVPAAAPAPKASVQTASAAAAAAPAPKAPVQTASAAAAASAPKSSHSFMNGRGFNRDFSPSRYGFVNTPNRGEKRPLEESDDNKIKTDIPPSSSSRSSTPVESNYTRFLRNSKDFLEWIRKEKRIPGPLDGNADTFLLETNHIIGRKSERLRHLLESIGKEMESILGHSDFYIQYPHLKEKVPSEKRIKMEEPAPPTF